MKTKLLSILLIALLAVGNAGAVGVSGDCKNVKPFFLDTDGLLVTSPDDFVLKDGSCIVNVDTFFGDWNGGNDIDAVDYEITNDDGLVISRTPFSLITPALPALPFVDAHETLTFTEADRYRVTVFVNDGDNEIQKSKAFRVLETPMFSVSDLNLGTLKPNTIVEKTITVTNNWGGPEASVTDLIVTPIEVIGDEGTTVIPVELVTTDLPSAVFAPGETVTVTVTIDLTGVTVVHGSITPAEWELIIDNPDMV